MDKLILASESPRRHALLSQIGLSFDVIPSNIDEQAFSSCSPPELVQRIAAAKAKAAAAKVDNGIIIAADTIVVLDRQIMGKPDSKEEAFAMLRSLSGRMHQVITGVCVYNKKTGLKDLKFEETSVFFRELSDEVIEDYIASGEPFDKAGGYGIQGLGALLIEKISGCYFNVVGLPLSTVGSMLQKQGVYVLGR